MIPHRCPKCDGLGWLQYDPAAPFAAESTESGPWPCPPCSGIGILYEMRPEDWAPFSPTPYPSSDVITWGADG